MLNDSDIQIIRKAAKKGIAATSWATLELLSMLEACRGRIAELEEELRLANFELDKVESEAQWDSHDCAVRRDRLERAMMGK